LQKILNEHIASICQKEYFLNPDSTFPLVIVLHGGGASGPQFESVSKLSIKADSESFTVVYPDGLENKGLPGLRTCNAGTIQMTSTCTSTKPIPIIQFHSKLDKNIPYQGGISTKFILDHYNPSFDST